jgi:hypothetical protein
MESPYYLLGGIVGNASATRAKTPLYPEPQLAERPKSKPNAGNGSRRAGHAVVRTVM